MLRFMSTLPLENIERGLREEDARLEATQNSKTYRGFCLYRQDSTGLIPKKVEDRIVDTNKSVFLEFISIVCERVSPMQIGAVSKRYDFILSGIEVPKAIDLPKSMSIQRVRVSPSTSQHNAKNMIRRIQAAVGDLDIHEIQPGKDPLSELLPLGGWHPVNAKLRLIHFQKDSIYEEFQPRDCVMPSCVICGGGAAKKEEEQQKQLMMEEAENKLE
jgi:hypothetical protein